MAFCFANLQLQDCQTDWQANFWCWSFTSTAELSDDPVSVKEMLLLAQQHLSTSVTTVDQSTTRAIYNRHLVYKSFPTPDHAFVLSISTNVGPLPDGFKDDTQFTSSALPWLLTDDFEAKQRADPVIGHVIAQLERGRTQQPAVRDRTSWKAINWSSITPFWRGFDLSAGTARRPTWPLVMHQLHNQMGHLGIERTLDLIHSQFYWSKMAINIVNKIKSCERCIFKNEQHH